MKSKTLKTIGTTALALTLVAGSALALNPTQASAAESTENQTLADRIKSRLSVGKMMRKQNPEIKTAIENNDYAAFTAAIEGTKLENTIDTEDKFNAMVEIHNLRMIGDNDAAKELAQEMGLPKKMNAAHKMNPDVTAAITNSDYSAFMTAVEGSKMAEMITTETQFNILVEIHNLREAGDHEAAQELALEAGFEMAHKDKSGRSNQEVKTAIENNDYEAYLTAVSQRANGKTITEDKFNILVEIHQLRESGDNEAAHNLAKENDLNRFQKRR